MSVRAFATFAGFAAYTTYSYYEGPEFTAPEIKKAVRDPVMRAFVRLGFPRERVAQLGPMPPDLDPAQEKIDRLERRFDELEQSLLGRRAIR